MREIGAFILSQLGTPEKPFADESFAALGPLLEDPYWEVRYAAAMAVGFLADADRQPPQAMRDRIIELARDESADVRAGVAVALGSIHHPVAAASLSRLLDDGDPGVQQDAELGLELRDVYGFDGGTRAAAE
jgi:HEAT repeat protein